MQSCRSLELVVPASNVVGRVVFVRGMVVKVRRVRTLLHLYRNARVGRHKHYDTHTHPFYDPLSRTTRVSRYQKGKTNLDFTEARDSEWQWHQLGHMQVCTSVQTDNHASTSPLGFLQAGCPSCRPTNSVKALKAPLRYTITSIHVSSGADVSQATHEQTSYVYDTSLIYRKKPYNKNSKTRSRRQAGRRMLPPGRSTHARTGGRTNRKHNADAAHKLAGGGTVKERIKISR